MVSVYLRHGTSSSSWFGFPGYWRHRAEYNSTPHFIKMFFTLDGLNASMVYMHLQGCGSRRPSSIWWVLHRGHAMLMIIPSGFDAPNREKVYSRGYSLFRRVGWPSRRDVLLQSSSRRCSWLDAYKQRPVQMAKRCLMWPLNWGASKCWVYSFTAAPEGLFSHKIWGIPYF